MFFFIRGCSFLKSQKKQEIWRRLLIFMHMFAWCFKTSYSESRFINIKINQLENLMEGRSLSVPMMVQDTQGQDLVLIFLATTGTTTSKHVKANNVTSKRGDV